MATIGSLSVNIFAKTAAFTKGLGKARKRLRGFTRGIGRSIGSVGRFGLALTAVAAGGGLALLTKKSFETIDATAKLSDRIGIATEDLGRLRLAAELTGAGQETLDKSLEQFVRRLGEAKGGTGEAKDALDALGLSADQLIAAGPAEAFKLVADATAKMGSQAEKADAAYGLFGRTGLKLINTLALGRDGLNEVAAEADKFGISVSRVDAARIEAANDAVTKLRTVIGGVVQQVAIQLAPVVTAIAEHFTEAAASGGGMGKIVVGVFEKIAKAIGFVGDFIDALKIGFTAAQIGATMLFKGLLKVGTLSLGNILKLVALLPDWLGGGIASNAAELLDATFDELDRTTDRLKKKLNDQLAEPPSSVKIAKFFDEIKKKSDETAKATAANAPALAAGLGLGTPGIPEPAKAGSFKQIVRSRTAIGGSSRGRSKTPIQADPREIDLLTQLVGLFKSRMIPGSAA